MTPRFRGERVLFIHKKSAEDDFRKFGPRLHHVNFVLGESESLRGGWERRELGSEDEPRRIEGNHEKFVRGVTVISSQVRALL